MGWFGNWFADSTGGTVIVTQTVAQTLPSPAGPFSGLDLSRDYLTWTNTQNVGFTSVGITQQQANIGVVKRRQINSKELSASRGAYVGNDVVFLVPQRELPENFAIKPRDQFNDTDGDFTVLSVSGQKRDSNGYQTWHCVTRNLSIAYNLQDVIDIQQPGIPYDAAGTKQKSWPDQGGGGSILYPQLSCRVQLLTAEVADELGIRGFQGNYAITVSKQIPAVNYECRVKWISQGVTRYLEIKGIHNPERIDELPVIDAELVA